MNCDAPCAACEGVINQPETYMGWMLWDLILRIGRQIRVSQGVFIGWDFPAALALGEALGVPPLLIADVLPEIEPIVMHGMNKREGDEGG